MNKGGKIFLGLTVLAVTSIVIYKAYRSNKDEKEQEEYNKKIADKIARLKKEQLLKKIQPYNSTIRSSEYKRPVIAKLPDVEDPGLKKFVVKK